MPDGYLYLGQSKPSEAVVADPTVNRGNLQFITGKPTYAYGSATGALGGIGQLAGLVSGRALGRGVPFAGFLYLGEVNPNNGILSDPTKIRTVGGIGTLVGIAAGHSTVVGVAKGIGAVAGAATGVAIATANLHAHCMVAGTITAQSVVAGVISAKGKLVGAASGAAMVMSDAGACCDIFGSVAAQATATGGVSAKGKLVGAVTRQLNTAGGLAESPGVLVASAMAISDIAGSVAISQGKLLGAANPSSSSVGTLEGTAPEMQFGVLAGDTTGHSITTGRVTDVPIQPPAPVVYISAGAAGSLAVAGDFNPLATLDGILAASSGKLLGKSLDTAFPVDAIKKKQKPYVLPTRL